MNNITIVILHYVAVEETINTVKSIQKNKNNYHQKINIIIVDNASPNDSGSYLRNYFGDDKNVTVILNNTNEGFARGNNVGFVFAKKNLNSDFIILSNNDILLSQNYTFDRIIDSYKKENFDIAGPNIISCKTQKKQNPVSRTLKNIGDVKDRRKKLFILYLSTFLYGDLLIQKTFQVLRRKNVKHLNNSKSFNRNCFELHGSFLIFGPEYIKKYNGLFDKTFMYAEEDILSYIALRDDLIVRYLDNIEITHLEDASTDEATTSFLKKRRFYYIQQFKSLKYLEKLMKEDYQQ